MRDEHVEWLEKINSYQLTLITMENNLTTLISSGENSEEIFSLADQFLKQITIEKVRLMLFKEMINEHDCNLVKLKQERRNSASDHQIRREEMGKTDKIISELTRSLNHLFIAIT